MIAWRPLLISMLALAIAGCAPSLLQQPAEPEVRTYLLDWGGDSQAVSADPSGPVLLVSPVLAAPGFDGSDMAYMRHPHQLEYFSNHRWVDSPARMLDPLLIRAAVETGRFRSVIETGSGARADLRLDSRLVKLVQACRLHPSELQMELRVSLIDVASARIVASATLEAREPVAERSPRAGVAAAHRALAMVLSQLQEFLAAQPGKR